MTEITRMQTICLVLQHPKNMHIKFLSISEVTAGKRHDFISNQGKPYAHCSDINTEELLLKKDMISFQIKARHLHIGPE